MDSTLRILLILRCYSLLVTQAAAKALKATYFGAPLYCMTHVLRTGPETAASLFAEHTWLANCYRVICTVFRDLTDGQRASNFQLSYCLYSYNPSLLYIRLSKHIKLCTVLQALVLWRWHNGFGEILIFQSARSQRCQINACPIRRIPEGILHLFVQTSNIGDGGRHITITSTLSIILDSQHGHWWGARLLLLDHGFQFVLSAATFALLLRILLQNWFHRDCLLGAWWSAFEGWRILLLFQLIWCALSFVGQASVAGLASG